MQNSSFQQAAEILISRKLEKTYSAEARVRHHLVRWQLPGIPGVLSRRVLRNLHLLSTWCHPGVQIVYFLLVWNGWSTDVRMRSLRSMQGLGIRGCVLGCGEDHASDSVEHYGTCRIF